MENLIIKRKSEVVLVELYESLEADSTMPTQLLPGMTCRASTLMSAQLI